jgi:dTDP-4-amino-4,6-dideoxygalactose transaminase
VETVRQVRRSAAITVPFVDLGPMTEVVKGPVLSDLEELMESGGFVGGRPVDEFETAFASYVGRSRCVGVASGLDALRLGLLALGLEPGDGVLVPALTFVATFEAVVQAGGVPIPVDVCEDDLGLDVDALAAACGPRTRFVVPVHLYGQMVDVTALARVAEHHDLVVLEDACQAHGASRDGVRAGAAGAAAAFSFYPSKNLGAMGDAGAFVTDDELVAAHVRALRTHGETRRYYSDHVGYTARLDAIQALVLRHKLAHLRRWNEERAAAAAFYTDALQGVGDLVLPVTAPGATHVWHLYTVGTTAPVRLADFLAARGIATGRHYPELPHLSRAFATLDVGDRGFPVAEAVAARTLSLPIFPGITSAQLGAVVDAVEAYFASGHGA